MVDAPLSLLIIRRQELFSFDHLSPLPQRLPGPRRPRLLPDVGLGCSARCPGAEP